MSLPSHDSDDFIALDLDLPADPTPTPSPSALTLVAAIRAIVVGLTLAATDAAFEALRALVLPVVSWPEGLDKVAVRTAKESKLAEINDARTTARKALSSNQVAPLVNTPVAPSLPIPEPVAAEWARIRTGADRGEWGVRLMGGVTVAPGAQLRVRRHNGHTSIKYAVRLAETSSYGSVYIVSDNPPAGAPGTLMHALAAFEQSTPVEIAAESAQEPAQETTPANDSEASLERDLTTIGAEGASNASTEALGSMRGGQLRGVGFSTAQGYIDALSHGVKLATADEYKRTLRSSYSYTDEQIAGLTVTIIPEASLPVGTGIKHTFEGPGVFDRPRSERVFKVGEAAKAVKSGTTLLRSGDLIAGSIVGGAGGDFSWHGAGKVTRAKLLAALAEIGREGDAPAAKNARAQAGRSVATLRNLGYHVHTISGTERRTLPSHVAHRYIIGRASVGSGAATVGEAYGVRVLTVDLHQDDTLHCTGQSDIAALVRADFEGRTAEDLYISADLTAWLQTTLRNAHGANRFGVGWYVPHGQVANAERLTRAVATIWGESWRHGMPVASCSHLIEGLTEGLADEVSKHEKAWTEAQDKARENRKLGVGTTRAASILASLTETADRLRDHALLLGDEVTQPLRDRIAKLDGTIRPLTDDTSARASMLEFT